jgi:hypothetical protein
MNPAVARVIIEQAIHGHIVVLASKNPDLNLLI